MRRFPLSYPLPCFTTYHATERPRRSMRGHYGRYGSLEAPRKVAPLSAIHFDQGKLQIGGDHFNSGVNQRVQTSAINPFTGSSLAVIISSNRAVTR